MIFNSFIITISTNRSNDALSLIFTDGRQGLCYTYRSPSGFCRDEIQYRLSKKDCCCGQHIGQGWGDDCAPCPEYGNGKFDSG